MAFIDSKTLGETESAKRLIENRVASRMAAKDGSVFDFDPAAAECANTRLGWTTLASEPPTDPAQIAVIAQQARGEKLDAVVLIGQGGSTQASQTITKLRSLELTDEVPFRTMDSLSPVYVNHILGSSDPAHTIYIVSSKSGSTLEPTLLSHVAWTYASAHLGEENAGSRFIAITDPGSDLEQTAKKNGWRAVLHGQPDVGGRYSALSVFGLLPMSMVGVDPVKTLIDATPMEHLCATDSADNPAIWLACFLYECLLKGRDKFSLLMPARNQVFGLWVEQLVAESLGKLGHGILPNVEIDAGILSDNFTDRSAILCNMNNDQAFEHARTCLNPQIPVFRLDIPDSTAMTRYFIIWEYAVAMCGWLMQINPFDQPDVESTKIAARQLLFNQDGGFSVPQNALGRNAYEEYQLDDCLYADKVYVSAELHDRMPLHDKRIDVNAAFRMLFGSIEEGDYFSLNAFLPFKGTGRRECLERIRHRVADRLDACSCLEIGPRYLHSTGQLHKGGPDRGVFLMVSSDETFDITVPHESFTLGDAAMAEALGDFSALSSRGRRAVYIHLRNNDAETLSLMADDACSAISAAYAERTRAKYLQ